MSGPLDIVNNVNNVNNVTIIPVSSTSAILSWSPGYYCVVNYTVTVLSSTNNTDQYNTSNNITSIVINLVTGAQYSSYIYSPPSDSNPVMQYVLDKI